MLELMTYLLRAFGRTVLHADNGLYGVALAGDRKPDLIACDVQLPGLDGYDVARRAGFEAYISKPIVSETFVEQLHRFLPPALRAGSLAPRRRLPCP
jgi:hypothetical protein